MDITKYSLKSIYYRFKFSKYYSYLQIAIHLFIIIVVISWFGVKWGVVGYLTAMCCYILFRIIKSRALFMYLVRDLETKVFGKPLDRKNWKKGEFKYPKIVRRKKEDGENIRKRNTRISKEV